MDNLFLIGFMGAGKSSVSQGLGSLLGREVVEMDQRIAQSEGMTIPESFAQGQPRIVSCGGGVPMREENVAAMRRCGTVVLLTARPEVILDRVKDDHNRPLLEGHKDVPYISSLMEQRRPKYEAAADVTVDTSDLSVEEVCREALRKIQQRDTTK